MNQYESVQSTKCFQVLIQNKNKMIHPCLFTPSYDPLDHGWSKKTMNHPAGPSSGPVVSQMQVGSVITQAARAAMELDERMKQAEPLGWGLDQPDPTGGSGWSGPSGTLVWFLIYFYGPYHSYCHKEFLSEIAA